MSEKVTSVSVTALADFTCRTGDLMPFGVAAPTAKEGIRAHKKVQRLVSEQFDLECSPEELSKNLNGKRKQDKTLKADVNLRETRREIFDTEVSLSRTLDVNGMPLILRGRVDILDFRVPSLSEIKTTLVPESVLPDSQKALHWAQLYLYGFLFLGKDKTIQTGSDEIELEMLYVNIRADTVSSDKRRVSINELVGFANDALELYAAWIYKIRIAREKLKSTASTLSFPHKSFRAGQRDMAAAVYRAIRDSESLLCEAPTGTGKTISTLFPSIKSLGEGTIKQVVYLTAKVAGRLSAMQSLEKMTQSGLKINAVQIRAKHSTCFCSIGRCERDETGRCPMTLGFFDRLADARNELLLSGVITDKQMDEVAWQHQLCPFELAIQMLPWVHVAIADYNYVFDPLVRLPHFSEPRSDAVLLIDEAHNLVDRSRSMFSGELSRRNCVDQAHVYRRSHPLVSKSLDKLSQSLLEYARDLDEGDSVEDTADSTLSRAAVKAIEAITATVGESPPLPDSSTDIFRALCRYSAISDLYGETHRTIVNVTKEKRRKQIVVSLYCLDASKALAQQYKLFKSSVVFSATLRPSLFYRDTLGLPEETPQIQINSPFNPKRCLHAIVDWIDTRYRKRYDSLSDLVVLIGATCSKKTGNYLVYFPSYAYLNLVFREFSERYPEVEVWCQTTDMTREEQSSFLEKHNQAGHRIGFAILGGIFGEGIDFLGDKLIGAIVVSTALPGLGTESDLVANHYQKQGHDGYDFTYRYPGFTRVLQTSGRVIRSEDDKGFVILVDDRFKQSFYKRLFPETWEVQHPKDINLLTSQIEKFWAYPPTGSGADSL